LWRFPERTGRAHRFETDAACALVSCRPTDRPRSAGRQSRPTCLPIRARTARGQRSSADQLDQARLTGLFIR
jgi:hypothetical protein